MIESSKKPPGRILNVLCLFNLRHLSRRWVRSSHRRCSLGKGVFKNFAKFTGKHLCQSLCNFIKKETLPQEFSSEFSEIFKNIFFTEHLRTSALVGGKWKISRSCHGISPISLYHFSLSFSLSLELWKSCRYIFVLYSFYILKIPTGKNWGSEFSSYKIKLHKMTSHFKLLTRKFLQKFFFWVTNLTSENMIFHFYVSIFELITQSWKIKSFTSSY